MSECLPDVFIEDFLICSNLKPITAVDIKKNNGMNIFKLAVLGAAVAYGINYVTKKREDGTTILDDLTRNAPDWMNNAKQFATQTVNEVKENFNRA